MLFLRNTPVDVLRYLPDFLAEDKSFKHVQDGLSKEHEQLRLRLAKLADQLFIPTAGEEGISSWERVIGLIPRADADLEARRRAVLLWLQSNQVSTVEFMRRLAARYYPPGTDVTIKEHNSEYYFELEGSRMPIDCGGLFDALEMYKPAHLGMLISFVLNGGTNLYMGGILSDVLTSGISTAPLPDEAHVPIYMGLVADDIPDGISVGMLSHADVPLVLGLAQSAMFNRIGPANFTPIGPEDLQLALRQYHGGYFDGDDIHRITSKSTMDFLHSGNYFGGVVFAEDGRITPSVACPADVHPAVAVFFTPKLKRIGCDMSDVDKMAEASYMPPTGCTSTKLNITAITELAADNIGPRAVLREATEPVDIGLILQVPSCRIAAWEGDYERKDE